MSWAHFLVSLRRVVLKRKTSSKAVSFFELNAFIFQCWWFELQYWSSWNYEMTIQIVSGLQNRQRKSALWHYLYKFGRSNEKSLRFKGTMGCQAYCVPLVDTKPYILPDHSRPIQVWFRWKLLFTGMSAKFLLLFIDVDVCSSSMLMLVRPAYALVAQLRLFFSFHSILSLTVLNTY